jgi:hypothetical protein
MGVSMEAAEATAQTHHPIGFVKVAPLLWSKDVKLDTISPGALCFVASRPNQLLHHKHVLRAFINLCNALESGNVGRNPSNCDTSQALVCEK